MSLRKTLLFSLSILLLLLSTACVNSNESNEDETQIHNSDNLKANGSENISIDAIDEADSRLSYHAELLSLPIDITYMTNFAYSDDTLYICGEELIDGEEFLAIYAVSLDERSAIEYHYCNSINERMIVSMDIDYNSMLWAIEATFEYENNSDGEIISSDTAYQLIRFNRNGEVDNSISLNKDIHPIKLHIYGEKIYIICYEKIVCVDDSGTVLYEIEVNQYSSTIKTEIGIFAGQSATDRYNISFLNDEEQTLENFVNYNADFNRISGNDNALFLDNGTQLYSYYLNDDSIEMMLSWASVGLLGNYHELFSLSDGKLLYCAFDGVYLLSPYENKGAGSGSLKLATLDAMSINRVVQAFNMSNDSYTIEIIDYSVYNTSENSTEGLSRLITEIVSGDVPDIIELVDIPSDIYENNHLLEDLVPYMENDAEFNISDCEPVVLEAMMSDGKLFNFTPVFAILSIAGNISDIAGSQINSFSDLQAIAKENNAFGSTLSRSQLLMYALGASNSRYYDIVSGACYFNSDEFIDFLKFTKTLPDLASYNNYAENIASGNQRFYCGAFGGIGEILAHRLYFNETMSFVGLPFSSGNETIIIPYYSYGMSSTSEHKDGVWEFFKFLATDAFLRDYCEYMYTISNSVTDYTVQLARDWHARGGQFFYIMGNQEVEVYITDDVDIDLFYELLNSVGGMFRYNEGLYNIVMESANDYFNDVITAEQAADIIQSRASIYMSERR